jgi:hypothetical protein
MHEDPGHAIDQEAAGRLRNRHAIGAGRLAATTSKPRRIPAEEDRRDRAIGRDAERAAPDTLGERESDGAGRRGIELAPRHYAPSGS